MYLLDPMGKYVSMFQLWGSFRKISWSRLKVSSCRSKLAIPGMDSIDMLWIKLYIVVWSFNELVMMIAVLSCIVNVRSCSLFLCAFVCVCVMFLITHMFIWFTNLKRIMDIADGYIHIITHMNIHMQHTHIYIYNISIYIFVYWYIYISKYI